MALFPMRLLHAQLPLHFNNTQLALNRTCLLQNTTQQILNLVKQGRLPLSDEELSPDERGVAEEVWLTRLVHVKFALCRCLLAMGVSHYYMYLHVHVLVTTSSIRQLCSVLCYS